MVLPTLSTTRVSALLWLSCTSWNSKMAARARADSTCQKLGVPSRHAMLTEWCSDTLLIAWTIDSSVTTIKQHPTNLLTWSPDVSSNSDTCRPLRLAWNPPEALTCSASRLTLWRWLLL